MITLSQPTNTERSRNTEIKRPSEAVETAGSLAYLFENGLMTMGQYDEYISSNPFAIDYSMWADCGTTDVAMGGFLSDFAAAVSAMSDMGGGFSAGFSSGDCGGGSCGGFTSVC